MFRKPCVPSAGIAVLATLAGLLLAAPPVGAQGLPPCGTEQITPSLDFYSPLHVGHTYKGEFQLGLDSKYDPVNLSVVGPAGVVGRVSLDDHLLTVTPRDPGIVSLTLTWDQRELGADQPMCSASTTLALEIREALPIKIARLRRGALADFEPWPCGGAATCTGARRNRVGIRFYLAAGKLDRYDRFPWDAADLTPVRVEARAVARAKRPGPAVAPAVLEFVARARGPRSAERGLVEIKRTRVFPYDYEVVEIWVAARTGLFSRGVSVTLTQGTRRLGSFAAVARCRMSVSFGSPSTSCKFKGRHRWLRTD